MNASDWFNAQSFGGRLREREPKCHHVPKCLAFDRWDHELGRWRHYRQDEDGTVTETNEIGEDL